MLTVAHKTRNFQAIRRNFRFPARCNYKIVYKILKYIILKADDKQILEKLKTSIEPIQCDESCVCHDLNDMGQFSYEKGTWISDCINRACNKKNILNYFIYNKERIECGPNCLKDNIPCKNRQIQ